MHAQRADKIALHHPECFSEEERIGYLGLYSLDHFTPKFAWDHFIKHVWDAVLSS